MITAAAYLRRSTTAQGASIERQRDEVMRYAQVHRLTIDHVYEDSASAYKDVERPGYEAMLAGARAGEFSALVVFEFSRRAIVNSCG